MTTDMTLFNKSTAMAMLDDIPDDVTSTLAGSGGTGKRISIRGGRFREVINGEEIRVSKEDELDVVIVAAAPMARHYYADAYVEGQTVAPTCWSRDTQVPADDVPEDQRQASKCMDCPQNVKGSGQRDDSRACRFSQRVAVVLDGAIEEGPVYQMQLPATSLFGDDKDKLGLQAYAKLLRAHKAKIMGLVTRLTMDTASTTPKLSFAPVRPLTEAEVRAVIEHKDSPDAQDAITFTVSQMDKVKAKAEPKEPLFKEQKKAAEPEPEKETVVEMKKERAKRAPKGFGDTDKAEPKGFGKAAKAETVAEPEKRAPKKEELPADAEKELDDILGEWDD